MLSISTGDPALALFNPLVARWFSRRYGAPTDVQAKAWPAIAAGGHVLVSAPTGTGKTLTAFLWALNELAGGGQVRGLTRVLYVSPLKALNNDILRNLLEPLEEIAALFGEHGEPFAPVRVMTRSGDTPQSERRTMQRRPPEILITTPESLNLLLNSPGGRRTLSCVTTVILDEIHGVFGTKRGTYLITAVERLARLAGEFQRIALSATLRPLEQVAAFIGGFTREGESYVPRPVRLVRTPSTKSYAITVRFPAAARERAAGDDFWRPLADDFRKLLRVNRSTLIFTNSRRLAEKVALKINEGEEEPLAYAHHGSLSREVRTAVEQRLKAGGLKAIVATSSLEMGIDIGALDEVILIQSPPSVSSAVQRVGRAGHRVGETSRGAIFPTHSRDLVDAAVLAGMIPRQEIEAIKPVESPLDVLAQVIVAMTAAEEWDLDELYAFFRGCWPYRSLRREAFDKVLEMLAGRYAGSRIRELRPRVSLDRLGNTAAAVSGALQLVSMGGGVIPDRGYFQMRHHKTASRLGELDEEFVWENPEGSTFTLGMQSWRVERITHNDVFVSPSREVGPLPPFWKGESMGRDFHFSERIGLFLEEADGRLEDGAFARELEGAYGLDGLSASALLDFLEDQKKRTGAPLPHRHHLLVEHIQSGPQGSPARQTVLHTLWGGRVNRPFALALQAAWHEKYGYQPEVYATDDCIIVISTHEVDGAEVLRLVDAGTLPGLLRRRLESSGFFGARFRENARTALLLTPNRMNRRMPLWLSRLRSQTLLEAVQKYDDFPILLETWRTCLQDEFDMESLALVLSQLESGDIAWTEARTDYASPFAGAATWEQVNTYMYMDDTPRGSERSKLREDLLAAVVHTPELRPAVPPGIARAFEEKRQRLSPGYSPATPRDLFDWVKERILIPRSEWERLLSAVRRDHGLEERGLLAPLEGKLVLVRPPGAAEPLVAAAEALPGITAALYPGGAVPAELLEGGPAPRAGDAEKGDEIGAPLLGEWLAFYGPVEPAFPAAALGMQQETVGLYLDELLDTQALISGGLVAERGGERICDSENFEILLRMSRAAARPVFEPLEVAKLPLFLARVQGLIGGRRGIEGVADALERLEGYGAPAELWESEFLPARVPDYSPSWLDTLMAESELLWVGGEGRRIAFCFRDDLDLVAGERRRGSGEPLFPGKTGRYTFADLLQTTRLDASALATRIWELVWSGEVSNDGFAALRRALENKFRLPAAAPPAQVRGHRTPGRSGFARWKSAVPFAGSWFAVPWPHPGDDLLAAEERRKDRVRILLDRYGILFRELLQRERPAFGWQALFRTLRLMELSGELLAGCFFEGIEGPQFISPQALRTLSCGLTDDVYVLNAADPASPCGLRLEGLQGPLPKRTPSSHLVFRGAKLVLVCERSAQSLKFHVPPDDGRLQEYLTVLGRLLTRRFQPLRRISVEKINGGAASESPFAGALRASFRSEVYDTKLILYAP